MRLYSFKCRMCGACFDLPTLVDPSCTCGSTNIGRDYSTVQLAGGTFKAHFNHAVGEYVSSSRDFDEKLKIAGDQAGSTFARLDPGDVPRPSTDDHIFDTQARTIHDRGIDPKTLV